MASKRRRPNGTWEYAFQRKGVLDERRYLTYDTEAEGDSHAERLELLLDRGVVAPELKGSATDSLGALLSLFEVTQLSQSDTELLPTLRKAIGDTNLSRITYNWVEQWVERMRDELAPSTLTKRVGLLARALDWGLRKGHVKWPSNPVRLLPKGYATRGVAKEKAWVGERDRRLEGTEEGAIRSVLTDKKEALLFTMALETAMRLREMYTLTVGQIDLRKRTIFLDKTKNGDKRQVPMSSVLLKELGEYLLTVEGEQVFPWWDGSFKPEDLRRTTSRLSNRFGVRFEKAGCPDLHFHDLRHEATARLYERTQLSDLQISKITGHKSLEMLQRYANLRGSDLADKLW